MTAQEEWRAVTWIAAQYQVSSLGRVRRSHRRAGSEGRFSYLKPLVKRRGYSYVRLSLGARLAAKWPTIHALVAHAFIGPRPNGAQVNHKDGNKANNTAANLEYVTDAENKAHAVANGLQPQGERNSHAKLTVEKVEEIKRQRADGVPRAVVAKRFSVNESTIMRITTGRLWTGKGCRRGQRTAFGMAS